MPKRDRPAAWCAFPWPGGHHHGAWRLPDPDTSYLNMSFANYKETALLAEEAKFDAIFLGDRLDSWPLPDHALAKTARAARLETITTCAAIAAVTTQIGIIATASTTFSEPYNIARQMGSLDQISGGRAGWNVVTSYTDDQAQNFGLQHMPPRNERYARAQEFVDVVKGLWDTFEDDTFIRNKETGVYMDDTKMHKLNHEGELFRVTGPLNQERPIQGYPVIAQAGASADGIAFAAKNGEVIFSMTNSIERGKAFYKQVKEAAIAAGRDPDDIRILVSLNPVIGETQEDADRIYNQMQNLLDDEVSTLFAEMYFGISLADYDLDELVPEIDLDAVNAANGMPRAHQELMLNTARDNHLTMRELVRGFNGANIEPMSAESAADMFQAWYEEEAADGFIIQFSHQGGMKDFLDYCAPILQERGVLRTEYEGTTLREHLGLKKPENQYAAARKAAAVAS